MSTPVTLFPYLSAMYGFVGNTLCVQPFHLFYDSLPVKVYMITSVIPWPLLSIWRVSR